MKNYILSQRLTYLTLGLVAGYFFGISEDYGSTFLVVFVVLGVILSFYFGRKDK